MFWIVLTFLSIGNAVFRPPGARYDLQANPDAFNSVFEGGDERLMPIYTPILRSAATVVGSQSRRSARSSKGRQVEEAMTASTLLCIQQTLGYFQ